MLNQIVVANTVCLDVTDQFAHNVHLVVSGEDQAIALQADELLDKIHHAICLEYILPQIVSRITVGVGRVTLAAVVTGTVAALIKGQEICMIACQFGGHPRLIQVNGKVRKNALVELETNLTRIAILLPLALCVLHALSGELILQLKGKYRNTK